jgi:hypothetical protein
MLEVLRLNGFKPTPADHVELGSGDEAICWREGTLHSPSKLTVRGAGFENSAVLR